jgi:excisionase family DNA binding protein
MSTKKLEYLTTEELASELRRPVSTIQRWARTRIIPSIHAGWRTRLYDPEAVRRALAKLTISEL